MAKTELVEPIKDVSALKRANDLFMAGELDKAAHIVENYLLEDPNDAQALSIASTIFKKADRIGIAYSLAKRSTELMVDRPEPWNVLGHCAQLLWRLDEARSAYRKAHQRAKNKGQEALYLNNLASIDIDEGEFSKAEPMLRKSHELDPQDTMCRHNLGLSLLAQRRWQEGWPFYSASVGTSSRLKVKYKQVAEPEWDGSRSRTVVVYGEQGLGDEICFASMLPDVIRDCHRVIVDCDKRLKGLFERSFPGAKVYGTRWAKAEDGIKWDIDFNEIDYSISAAEVGKFYRNADEDFPGTAYIIPCPVRTAAWRAVFADKPTIGIAWTGGTFKNAAMYRKMSLTDFMPLFRAHPGARFVSLQYKDAEAEIQAFKKDHPEIDLVQYPWATLTKDYDDTAALVAALNRVVTIQTSIGHLCGALGQRVDVMLPDTGQWRYGENGERMPWYQSMRIIRKKGRAWSDCVREALD